MHRSVKGAMLFLYFLNWSVYFAA